MALMQRAGRVMTRQQLVSAVRDDPHSFVEERIVDVYVARLRKVMRSMSRHDCPLETVVGLGYRWRAP